MRAALYSHDSVGLGHVRRNLALAGALATSDDGERVGGLVITSQPSATVAGTPGGWDWLVLPGIRPSSDGYAARDLDLEPPAVARLRGALVASALEEYRPELLIVDRHPFGASGELRDTIERLRRQPDAPRIVLGLRDVLDEPRRATAEWEDAGGAGRVADAVDEVWVYGDPAVHDPVASGEIPAELAEKVSFTGYLSLGRRSAWTPQRRDPFVLTMVGGGSDGASLAGTVATIAPPRGVRSLIVTGPQMPSEHVEHLRRIAVAGVDVVRQVPDALALVQRAEAVVCMAGYNSLAEVMSTRVPALVVPRHQRRQEQRIRAAALARHGVVAALDPEEADRGAIRRWLHGAVGRRVDRTGLRRDGLAVVPSLARGLVAGHPDGRRGLPLDAATTADNGTPSTGPTTREATAHVR
ncbi:glycosyltransferase family protein [Mycetocola reblochoni]|uniref:Mlr3248 protein n=2 Tax=Mycetocola reblochoni TaxID=331618 RepID=A0A1R4K8Q1_9MICO|nr:glycosyltransferase [Mycetocola reblochoni]RLP68088.1 glycosyl transferase family 28 [Mycetocola reblochoni]SJN40666.1 Mlr3248 protein [Mycetocola reblochoni REB411]